MKTLEVTKDSEKDLLTIPDAVLMYILHVS